MIAPGSCLYIVQALDLFKVGQSAEPFKRFSGIKADNPVAKLAAVIYDGGGLEKQAHRVLKAWHVSGEWFRLSNDSITCLWRFLQKETKRQQQFITAEFRSLIPAN